MRKLHLIFIFFVIFSNISFSADNFTSPYWSVQFCSDFITEESKEYSEFIHVFASNKNDAIQEDLAKKFIIYLESNSLFFEPKKAPKAPNFLDSNYNVHHYYPFTTQKWIYFEKIKGEWLISESTVNEIANAYETSSLVSASKLQRRLPQGKFLGLRTWQWLGMLVYAIISMILYKLLNILFHTILVRVFHRLKFKRIFDQYIDPVSKPISLFVIISVIYLTLGILQLPVTLAFYMSYALKIILIFFATMILFRSCNVLGAIMAKAASRTESTVDDQLVPLIIKILKIVVVVLGAIYIVKSFGWTITPLLAGASIGGIAIAMSAQDTVKNLFGSFTMFTDQPFEVGDWIVFQGGEGSVIEVGIRSTRIRTFYDSVISIPNGQLANTVIDNMGKRTYRRYVTRIGVTYDTHPDAIDAFVEGLKGLVDNHPNTRDYYQIHLNDFGASAIEILFYVFFVVNDWTEELQARHELLSDVIRLAKTLDIRFAFNTQTIHVEDMPGQTSLTPLYTNDSQKLKEKNNLFLQQNKEKYKGYQKNKKDNPRVPLKDGEE